MRNGVVDDDASAESTELIRGDTKHPNGVKAVTHVLLLLLEKRRAISLVPPLLAKIVVMKLIDTAIAATATKVKRLNRWM